MPSFSEKLTGPVASALDGNGELRLGTDADRVDGVAAGLVVKAADAAEVSTALAGASAAGATVVIRGAGTKLDWGHPPRHVDVVIDVGGLDTVLEHAAGDLVVRVQPGVRLADLAIILAPAGQRLAIDEMVPGSTIGGVIATGLAGPLRLVNGAVRDLLVGVTVVLADGRSATSGGRVVKNVAGYDLGKLYTGSYGTLGVITEAFLRLHPLPERSAWVTVPAPGAAAIDRAALALSAASVTPAAIEVHVADGGTPVVVALLEGTERGVDGRLAAAAGLLGDVVEVTATAPPWWGRLPGLGAGETLIKATTTISEVGTLVAALRDLDAPVEIKGSAGVGVLYAALPATVAPEVVAPLVVEVRRACGRAGGAAVVLRAPPGVRASVDTWGPIGALDLMRRVKDRFDPAHLLGPGRFVGGI